MARSDTAHFYHEPRGGSSSSIRSEGASTRCGRNYQQKSPQPSCTSGSRQYHVAGKRAQCCKPNAAAVLLRTQRAQLFVRTHRHPLAPPILCCTGHVRAVYGPSARVCSALCVRGGRYGSASCGVAHALYVLYSTPPGRPRDTVFEYLIPT